MTKTTSRARYTIEFKQEAVRLVYRGSAASGLTLQHDAGGAVV
jgi:transposase-like protein